MGATNIQMILDGNKTTAEIEQAFKEAQANDKMRNGHRDGYSGDFQTVDEVKIEDVVFGDQRGAEEYCLDKAEKWEFVVAVKFKDQGVEKWLIAGWGAE